MLGDFINAVADGLFEKGFGDEGEEVYILGLPWHIG